MTSGFDYDEAQALHARLTAQIKSDAAERDRLTASIDGMKQMVTGLTGLFPALVSGKLPTPAEAVETTPAKGGASRPEGLTSLQVVTRVVEEVATGSEAVSVASVVEAMRERDWLPEADDPTAAVRTALVRAKNAGMLESVKLDGRSNGYRPIGPMNPSGPADTGPEVGVPSTGTGGDSDAQADRDHGDYQTRWDRDDQRGASVAEAH